MTSLSFCFFFFFFFSSRRRHTRCSRDWNSDVCSSDLSEVVYDGAYQRGMDTATIPVLLLLARPYESDTGDAMGDYLSGAGPRSVKQAIQTRSYQACDTVV